MTIAFPCEKCGYRFEVDGALAGKKCKCKTCGHVFLVPVPMQSTTAPAKTKVKTAPRETKSASPQRPRERPAPTPPPIPAYGPDDPYDFDSEPALPPRVAKRSGGWDDSPYDGRSSGDDEEFAGPRPIKAKSRKRYNGEPWSPDLRWAAVFFTLVGLGGYVLLNVATAIWIQETNLNLKDLQAGKLPGTGSHWIILGVLILGFLGSFFLGLVLTFVSFLGTFISFFAGNRRAFSGDDILIQIGWYGSGAIMVAVGLFIGAVVTVAIRGVPTHPVQRGFIPPMAAPAPPQFPPFGPDRNVVVTPPVIVPPAAEKIETPQAVVTRAPRMNPIGPRFGPRNRPGGPAPLGPPPGFGNTMHVESQSTHVERRSTQVVVQTSVPDNMQGGDFVEQALADLKSQDASRRRNALSRLAGMPADKAKRAEIAAAIEPLLKDPGLWVRGDAAKALKVWGDSANAPGLIAALNDPEWTVRGNALEALAVIKDPDGAEAASKLLVSNRHQASEALKTMGPVAEPAVRNYLSHGDAFVRMEACNILKVIGTRESIPALQVLLRRTNGQGLDAMAAQEALRWLNTSGPGSSRP